MNLNPDFPTAFGVQWLANFGQWRPLAKTPTRLIELPATTAETVDAFRMHITDSGTTGQTFLSLLEVWDGDIRVPGSSFFTAAPSGDADGSTIGASGWRREPGAATTDLWQAIDDPYVWPPPPSVFNTYVRTTFGSSIPYQFHIDTAAFPLTARVLRLRIRAVVGALELTGPYGNRPFRWRLAHNPGGTLGTETLWDIPGGFLYGTGFTTPVDVDLGEINPVTRLPWTPTDIRGFDPSVGEWAIRVQANGNSATAATVILAELVVSYVTENRVAVGVWERPEGQGPGLITTDALIEMPAGTAGWSKPSSGQFKYGWRIADDRLLRPDGVPSVSSVGWLATRQRISGGFEPPVPAVGQIRGANGTVDQFGRYSPEPVFDGSLVMALQMMVGGNVSTDSFAYGLTPDADGLAVATSTTQVAQRMTPSSNQSYLGFRFVVRPPAAAAARTLTVSVHRVSDGVQMGGSFTISSAEVRQIPQAAEAGWWLVEGFLSAGAALVSGTQYELRFTVAGTSSWSFPRLRALSAGAWTFGGTANTLRVGGSTFTDSDMPGVLLQQPAQPSTLTAEVIQVLNGEGVACQCKAPAVDAVTVSWVNPAITGFDRTEVWRYEDRDDVEVTEDSWELVHVRRTSSGVANSWTDWSAPRGVPVQYRLRNFTTAGAFSEWRATQFVTPHAYGCELIFTSNFSPELTVVYEHEPEVRFEFADHRSDRLVQLQDRPYQVAFMDPTRRGMPKSMRVIANFGARPCDSNGRPLTKEQVFEPLARLARAHLPYVVVLSSDGGRVLAHLEMSDGINEEPAWRYYVTVTITPVAATVTPTESD